MKIAIDVDDTICESLKNMLPYIAEYYNKDYNELINKKISYSDLFSNDYPGFVDVFGKLYYEKLVIDAELLPNVKEVLKKWKNNGDDITFITSRSKRGFRDPYNFTLDFLNKNGIVFDRLVCSHETKDKYCKEHNIELFIDDSVDHCDSMDKNIKCILVDQPYNESIDRYPRFHNWLDIDKYVETLRNQNN